MHAVLICINPKYMNSATFLEDLLVMIISCILLMRREYILLFFCIYFQTNLLISD